MEENIIVTNSDHQELEVAGLAFVSVSFSQVIQNGNRCYRFGTDAMIDRNITNGL